MEQRMMTLEEMQERKRELKFSYMKISELSGVPYPTVQKVLGGVTQSPRYQTLRALEKVLAPAAETKANRKNRACERNAPGERKDRAAEFQKWQDCMAVKEEWLDGRICSRIPLSAENCRISAELCRQIGNRLREKRIRSGIFIFPFPVHPEPGEKTVLRPDICVVTDAGKIKNRKIRGAPDLAVDILSSEPDTCLLFDKLDKYRKNGTQEYWVINIKKQTVQVFAFDRTLLMQMYSFHDVLPLHIAEEELMIDLAQIYACGLKSGGCGSDP